MNFLLRLYFGTDPDRIGACVKRAYRDLQRTLRGVARLPDGKNLREQATLQIRNSLDIVSKIERDQDVFDDWHRRVCGRLCALYKKHGFCSEDGVCLFTDGQAQKWLNMAFKYIYVFGEEQIPGFEGLYRLAHVPLDNVMLSKLEERRAPSRSVPWSRFEYDEYFRFQKWIRQNFDGRVPLAVEFHLWQITS